MTERRYLTTRQVSEILSLSVSKIQAMCSQGELPVERFGRSVRIEASALTRWLEERHGDGRHPQAAAARRELGE